MIDTRHIVDAMTHASSPVDATRGSRFVHVPAQPIPCCAVTMRI